MNESKLPSEFVKALLAQDVELNSAAFDQQRRQILDRLAEAEKNERRSRKVAMMTCGTCFAILLGLSTWAIVSHSYSSPEGWPNWLLTTLALTFILVPVSTLMICSLYFFRYRRGFVRLQKEAYQQTLLALPRQIKELRQNLE